MGVEGSPFLVNVLHDHNLRFSRLRLENPDTPDTLQLRQNCDNFC